MKPIKEIIEKKKFTNVPCPQCGEDQGRFINNEGTSWFECCACPYKCLRANYTYERKQYHKRQEESEELVIEEIDPNNIKNYAKQKTNLRERTK